MHKYYRVRNQQQWNWLMKYFEKQNKNISWYNHSEPTSFDDWEGYKDKTVVRVNGEGKLSYADYQFYVDRDKIIADFIEVSSLMEDEKMKNYITIKGEDLWKIHQQDGFSIFHHRPRYGGPVKEVEGGHVKSVRIPKSLIYPKIKFTEKEKAEFDELRNRMTGHYDLDDVLTKIMFDTEDDYSLLYCRLFATDDDRVISQLEFGLAWAHPELIEVIPEKKWNVHVPHLNRFYFKYKDGKLASGNSCYNDTMDQQFTLKELKRYGIDDENIYKREEVKQ